MVHGHIWLLGLYFELFPHNNNINKKKKKKKKKKNNNNCYQALTCAGQLKCIEKVKSWEVWLLQIFCTKTLT